MRQEHEQTSSSNEAIALAPPLPASAHIAPTSSQVIQNVKKVESNRLYSLNTQRGVPVPASTPVDVKVAAVLRAALIARAEAARSTRIKLVACPFCDSLVQCDDVLYRSHFVHCNSTLTSRFPALGTLNWSQLHELGIRTVSAVNISTTVEIPQSADLPVQPAALDLHSNALHSAGRVERLPRVPVEPLVPVCCQTANEAILSIRNMNRAQLQQARIDSASRLRQLNTVAGRMFQPHSTGQTDLASSACVELSQFEAHSADDGWNIDLLDAKVCFLSEFVCCLVVCLIDNIICVCLSGCGGRSASIGDKAQAVGTTCFV
jgi:hypothetical protein